MPSDFLTRLSPEDRGRLERIGQTVELGPRQHLLVRGERGGDVYRVERGQLEIVDRRSRPEVILDVLGPGELVGELGFINGAPRSADAFAAPGTVITRWPVGELQALLSSDTAFSARFWRALAEEVADRLRAVTSNAVIGGLRGAGPTGGDAAGAAPGSLASSSLDALAQVDQALRRDPADQRASARAVELLDRLAADLAEQQREGADPGALARSVRRFSRQVHPYLLRAATAELSLTRPEGFAGGPGFLGHVLAAQPSGDGPFGVAVDRWLLGLPRAAGLRARHLALSVALEAMLATHLGPLRLVLVNASQGGLLARAWRRIASSEGELWVVEPTRGALTELDMGLHSSRSRMKLRLVQERAGDPVQESSLRGLEGVHAVVADHVLDYLPARLAADWVRAVGRTLGPRGRLLLTATAPSADAPIWNHLLEWPVIAREPGAIEAILRAAGCSDATVSATEGAGLLAVASVAR